MISLRLSKKGFALISTLLFLPLALMVLVFCAQVLFFNKMKNEILEDCFLYSIENVGAHAAGSLSVEGLNHVLLEKFKKLNSQAPFAFFNVDLKFNKAQRSDSVDKTNLTEMATVLQLSLTSQNINFKNFNQIFKCGAFLKWKDSKKFYGIIAVKY